MSKRKKKEPIPKATREGVFRLRVLHVLYALARGGMWPEEIEEYAEVSTRTFRRILRDAREVGFIVDREDGRLYLSIPVAEQNTRPSEEEEEGEEQEE